MDYKQVTCKHKFGEIIEEYESYIFWKDEGKELLKFITNNVKDACYIEFNVAEEYDDENYYDRIIGVSFYDKDRGELSELDEDKESDLADIIEDISLDKVGSYLHGHLILINNKLPEIYIKNN